MQWTERVSRGSAAARIVRALACVLVAVPWGFAIPAGAQSISEMDRWSNMEITAAERRSLATDALNAHRHLPERGRSPYVNLRIAFPASQTGLDNIMMVQLVPIGSGAHQCESIAVQAGPQLLHALYIPKKGVRPGYSYDVVVSDSMGDRFLVGRVAITSQASQSFVVRAPLLTPGSPHYAGPQAAPPPSRLGISGATITPAMLARAGLPHAHLRGVIVSSVAGGSPAQRAGLRSGDIIVSFDGAAGPSIDQVLGVTRSGAFTRPIALVVLRATGLTRLTIVPTLSVEQRRAAVRAFEVTLPELGARVVAVTPEFMQILGHPEYGNYHGVVIAAVDSQSLAARAGLRKKDWIVEIDGQPCLTVEQLRTALATRQPVILKIARPDGFTVVTLPQGQSWKPPTVGPGFVPPGSGGR